MLVHYLACDPNRLRFNMFSLSKKFHHHWCKRNKTKRCHCRGLEANTKIRIHQ